MKTVCELDKCAGCMACVDICPKDAISIKDTLSAYNAVIDNIKCINCGSCMKICQKINTPVSNPSVRCFQGWASDLSIRRLAASGGIATALAKAFVEKGGFVYSCCFSDGVFQFEKASNVDEVQKFIGTKYIKSNPSSVYRSIKVDLIQGNKVLFIGLPCQVAAVKNYVGKIYENSIFTVDLVCHGTPSPKFLEMFLNQYDLSLTSMKAIIFRVKSRSQDLIKCESITKKGVSDSYSIAFLNCLFYTDNCYECDYAKRERISDITLGDAWGSEMGIHEKQKGISLVLCQTEKGIDLLEQAGVVLYDMDYEVAVSNNHQLEYPSALPSQRNQFFTYLKKGKHFNSSVFSVYPKKFGKQRIKSALMKMGVKKHRKNSILDYGIQYVK